MSKMDKVMGAIIKAATVISTVAFTVMSVTAAVSVISDVIDDFKYKMTKDVKKAKDDANSIVDYHVE